MSAKQKINPAVRQRSVKGLDDLMAETNSSREKALVKLEGTTSLYDIKSRIPSGSLKFDLATGVGGWPRGRMYEIYGPESCGKTTTVLHAAREAQALGMGVIFIDAEYALDVNYMRKLGIDTDLVGIAFPDNLQQAIDLMNDIMEKGREKFGNDIMIVVDSIPALKTSDVMEGDASKETRGGEAKWWAQQLPRLISSARKTNTSLFFINQMRDSMDAYTAASTPGGRAIKHNASLRVKMDRKVEGKNNAGAEGTKGQLTLFRIEKNKVGSPFKQGDYWLPAGESIVYEEDVFGAAILENVNVIYKSMKDDGKGGGLTKSSNWYHLPLTEDDLVGMRADAEAGGFPFEYEGATFMQKYHVAAFIKEFEQFPSLVAAVEHRCLLTLNVKDDKDKDVPFSDLDTAGADEVEDEPKPVAAKGRRKAAAAK